MNAPVFWFILPILLAVLFYLIPHDKTVSVLASGTSLVLAAVAILLPPDTVISILGVGFKFFPTITFFGRSFTLSAFDQPILVLVFLFAGFWFLAGVYFDVPRRVTSIAMIIIGLLVASISVEPFLYSAILIEVASIILIPALIQPGTSPSPGIMRFLINQTLGMPFILLAGFLLSGVEAGPNDLAIVLQAMLMLALGFAFLLSIFPFYTWAPLLARDIEPHLLTFILLFFPFFTIVLGLEFIDRYAWLRNSLSLYSLLQIVGLVTILTTSLWAAFEKQINRLLSFFLASATGYSLLILSSGHQLAPIELFYYSTITNLLVLGTLGIAINLIKHKTGANKDQDYLGIALQYPYLSSLIAICLLSYSGMPLFAHFPVRFQTWSMLGQVGYPSWIFLISMLGFLFSSIRIASAMFKNQFDGNRISKETPREKWFVLLSITLIILLGILPNLLPGSYFQVALSMPNLVR